jgi:UDP-glucose 6-dehydrogenase
MKIAIAGTGYVGLSNATLLAQHNEVVCIEIVSEKVAMLNPRQSVIEAVLAINSQAVMVIKSTETVGYSTKLRASLRAQCGSPSTPEINLFFSPEFLHEGRALYDNLHPKGIEVIMYEPVLKEAEFYNSKEVNDLAQFKQLADVIVVSRITDEIRAAIGKIYSRDLFAKN